MSDVKVQRYLAVPLLDKQVHFVGNILTNWPRLLCDSRSQEPCSVLLIEREFYVIVLKDAITLLDLSSLSL